MARPPAPLSRAQRFVTAGLVAPWLAASEAISAGFDGFDTFAGCAILAIVGALALAAPLPAQQLMPAVDAEFDGSVGSWAPTDEKSQITYGVEDVTGCGEASGSARAENNATVNTALRIFGPNCIGPVVGGRIYSFGGFIRFAAGQTATGTGQFVLTFFDGTDCTLFDVTAFSEIVPSSLAGTWVPSMGTWTSPAGAQSARVRFYLARTNDGNPLRARIDSVYVARGDYIFNEGFEIGSTCRWSGAFP